MLCHSTTTLQLANIVQYSIQDLFRMKEEYIHWIYNNLASSRISSQKHKLAKQILEALFFSLKCSLTWPFVFHLFACYEVICSIITSSSAHRGNFDILNVPYWVAEMTFPVVLWLRSQSRQLDVSVLFKYHFILKRTKRGEGNYIPWVLFVHKAFWKLHLTISVLLLPSLNLLGVDLINSNFNDRTFLPVVEDIFKMLSFVIQIIDGDYSQTVAWR